MRCIYWILLVTYCQAEAQMPRNAAGLFEYTQTIPLENMTDSAMQLKARRFFSQPFLVHWDSVTTGQQPGQPVASGIGYVEIQIISGFSKMVIPVQLQMDLTVSGEGYRYSIGNLKAVKKSTGMAYPLEEKPPIMKYAVYDKLVNRTQRYITSMIAWLKTYMESKPSP